MKKIFTLALAISIGISAYAQKIKIKESKENIGGGNNNALVVTIYGVDPSDAEKEFKSIMKEYGGKSSTKDGIFVDNATIKSMGNNTIDVYARALGSKGDKEITFVVAFDLGGAFLNSSDHKDQYKTAEKLVKDFAVKVMKESINDELKDAEKVKEKIESDQALLVKGKKSLEEDIVDYKTKIAKAEQDITKNIADQQKKKTELEAQQKIVDEINTRLKAVE
jgi:hypothetical protein